MTGKDRAAGQSHEVIPPLRSASAPSVILKDTAQGGAAVRWSCVLVISQRCALQTSSVSCSLHTAPSLINEASGFSATASAQSPQRPPPPSSNQRHRRLAPRQPALPRATDRASGRR
ncbi:unnamed protein product [Gadus morhua 'NCC']